MTEKLLQFIWRFQYFNRSHLVAAGGEPITILFPGQHNKEQGPDFLQARISLGGTLLAGSVELHLRTSDWDRHHHSADPNYKNVILHVVYDHDMAAVNLPVLELQPRISKMLLDHYERLMQSDSFIPCGGSLKSTPPITWEAWKDRLLAERLQRKATHLVGKEATGNLHWEEGLWRLLARSFGARTNADAFEAVALSLPVKVLARHSHSIHQIEALLLGQARLLDHDYTDDYPKLLQREYRFLQQKLNLQPIHIPVHFLRMRPPNFPTVRLAQLAALMQQSTHLFSKILEATTLQQAENLLGATANDYWHYHYRFDEAGPFQPKKLGREMIHHLIINVIAPVLYAYGSHHRNPVFTERAIDLLQQLPPENNAVTRGFKEIGILTQNAAGAQAVLELRNAYCNERRCLECAAGNSLLKRTGNNSL